MNPDLASATASAATRVTDIEVAVGVAALVAVIFFIAFWTQRTRPHNGAIGGHAKEWAEVFDDRLDGFGKSQHALEERQKSLEHDVKNIRTGMQALPNKDTVHRLEVQVAEMRGQIATVETTSTLMARAVDRVENFLLTEKRDK